MSALESSQAGRTRLVFVPTASSVSWENFTTQPVRMLQILPPLCVTVEYYHAKANLSRILAIQARHSSKVGHYPSNRFLGPQWGFNAIPRTRKEVVKVASIGLVEAVGISRMRCTHLSGRGS